VIGKRGMIIWWLVTGGVFAEMRVSGAKAGYYGDRHRHDSGAGRTFFLEDCSEGEPNFHLFVLQWRDGLGPDQWLAGRDALAPRRDCALAVVTLEVLPVGDYEVGVPLVKIVDTDFMQQLHAEAGSLVFVVVKNLHERSAVSGILERPQLFRERRGDPLDTVPEEMQQNEALHFEIHVWIESETQAVKNARARRLKVTIFDRKAIFHDPGGDPQPDIHQRLRGHHAHQTVADQLVPGDLRRVLLAADSLRFHDQADPTR